MQTFRADERQHDRTEERTSHEAPPEPSPPGLPPVERGFMHKKVAVPSLAPTGLAPGGAEACAQGVSFGALPSVVQKPPLHRGEPFEVAPSAGGKRKPRSNLAMRGKKEKLLGK